MLAIVSTNPVSVVTFVTFPDVPVSMTSTAAARAAATRQRRTACATQVGKGSDVRRGTVRSLASQTAVDTVSV